MLWVHIIPNYIHISFIFDDEQKEWPPIYKDSKSATNSQDLMESPQTVSIPHYFHAWLFIYRTGPSAFWWRKGRKALQYHLLNLHTTKISISLFSYINENPQSNWYLRFSKPETLTSHIIIIVRESLLETMASRAIVSS